jgi:TP901 family phage tail tape measure protein
MAFSLNLGALSVTLGLDADAFSKGAKEAESKWAGLKSSLSSSGAAMGKSIAAGAALAAGGIALVAKAAADFEMELTKAASVSAEGMKAFDGFKEAAMSASAGSMASATEAAQALKYLAMAGFSSADAMKALPDVIRLSSAAGLSLATTADVASDMLSGFSLKAADLAHVNDVLALGFNRTNTSLELLYESMKYVAPAATSAGQSIETMTAAVGLMSNVGVKGSMAGTSLRMALLRMQEPPKKAREALNALGIEIVDQSGKMRDFVDIIGDFEKAQKKFGQADFTAKVSQVVGVEAVSGFLGIINQGEGALRKLRDEMVSAKGTTADLEKQMMQTFSGQFQVAKGNVENLLVQIGDGFLPLLKSLTTELTTFAVGLQQDGTAAAELSRRITEFLPALAAVIELSAFAVQGFARLAGVLAESANGYSILALAAKRWALEEEARDAMFNTAESNRIKGEIADIESKILELGDRTGTIYDDMANSADRFADGVGRVADIVRNSEVTIRAQTTAIKTQEEAIKDAAKALSAYGAQWRGIGEGSNFVETPRSIFAPPPERFAGKDTRTASAGEAAAQTRSSDERKRAAEERAALKLREEIAAIELAALNEKYRLAQIDLEVQASIEKLKARQLTSTEMELETARVLLAAEEQKKKYLEEQTAEMEKQAAASKKLLGGIASAGAAGALQGKSAGKGQAEATKDAAVQAEADAAAAREELVASVRPFVELAGGFADMLGDFGTGLKKIIGVGAAALEGFASGGAMGALQGGLMALAGTIMDTIGESQAFQDNMSALGSMFEGFGIGDIVDSFFKSFQPAIGAIISVFKSFGGMNLDSFFEAAGRGLFDAVKKVLDGILFFKEIMAWAGYMQQEVLRQIVRVINTASNKMAEFVDDIPGFDRPDTSAINNFYAAVAAGAAGARDELDAVKKQREDLAKLTYDQGQAIFDETLERQKSAEAMRELNDELRNAPSGFKLALARFTAQDAAAPGASAGTTTRQQGLNVGNVMVFGDPAALLSGLNRRQFISTGTTSPISQRFAAQLAGRL